jgi:hypothetical protein
MNVSIPGEAGVMEGIAQGGARAVDDHFDRRVEAMLDEAAASGHYFEAAHTDFDDMERDARRTAGLHGTIHRLREGRHTGIRLWCVRDFVNYWIAYHPHRGRRNRGKAPSHRLEILW